MIFRPITRAVNKQLIASIQAAATIACLQPTRRTERVLLVALPILRKLTPPPSNPADRERAIHVPAAFLIGSSSFRYRAVCHNRSACSCFVFRRSLPPTYIMMLNFVLCLQSGCSEEA